MTVITVSEGGEEGGMMGYSGMRCIFGGMSGVLFPVMKNASKRGGGYMKWKNYYDVLVDEKI